MAGDDCRRESYDDLRITFDDFTAKNDELERMIDVLREENAHLKKKCSDLNNCLNSLNSVLEASARIFQGLYDDTKCALEMGRLPMLSSPGIEKRCVTLANSVTSETSCAPSTVANSGNDLKNCGRRKLHIEPINMNELQKEITLASNSSAEQSWAENLQASVSLRQGLSTILEESIASSASRNNSDGDFYRGVQQSNVTIIRPPKQVIVQLDQLPSHILEYYLEKDSSNSNLTMPSTNNSSLDLTDGPTFESTPLKLITMAKLGLTPTNAKNPVKEVHNFVNTRRQESKSKNANVKTDNVLNFHNVERASSSTKTTPQKKQKSNPPSKATGKENSVTPLKKIPYVSIKREKFSPKIEKHSLSPKKENLRRSPRESSKRSQSACRGSLVVKKQKVSSEGTLEKILTGSPMTKVTPTPGRPVRKARPQNLKEESLQKKKRRM